MSNKYNYIIVGQGLAGSCLALHLIALGQKVLVIDQQQDNSSSNVAAGLYNPITGRKMVLTWKAALLFDYMHQFYRQMEGKLDVKLLYDTTIYRPFVSLEEQNEWMGKSTQSDYKPYIKKLHLAGAHKENVVDPYGGLELANSGYLDVPEFVSSTRHYLAKIDSLLNEKFEYNQLNVHPTVTYKSFNADKIIFCTGPDQRNESYFDWLPFSLVKGELINITPEVDFDLIFNRGVFIMPRKGGKYVVGATYDTKDTSLNITEKARNTLKEKLEVIFNQKYTIIDQRAGIRPATRDRRPFVGIHPEMKQIGVFNGLGAKGVTLAPYFARQFANSLVGHEQLEKEVNISRFYSLYYQHST